jgi:HNH endonuclease
MIKLTLPNKPNNLTATKEAELVKKYQETAERVWSEAFIKKPFLITTAYKCAYCERKPNDGGAYPTIDHILPKSKYPEKVVDWDNLIPACAQCNNNKSNLDTEINPILNPFLHNPPDYLVLIAGLLYPIKTNPLATTTILELKLNQLEDARAEIQLSIRGRLSEIFKLLNSFYLAKSTAAFNEKEITLQLNAMLRSCSKDLPYTATKVTEVFQNDSTYYRIKNLFLENKCWSFESQDLENILKPLALCGNSLKP